LWLVLPEPEMDQFDFRLLVGNDFLRKPAHLRVLPVQQFSLGHIERALMMWKHQPFLVIVSARLERGHFPSPCNKYICALAYEPLCRCETNPAVAAGYQCNPSFKLAHIFLVTFLNSPPAGDLVPANRS